MQTGNPNRLEELIRKWYDGRLEPSEQQELLGLLQDSDTYPEALDALQTTWMGTAADPVFSHRQKEKMLHSILKPKSSRTIFLRVAAVAAVLLGAIVATVFLLQSKSDKEGQPTVNNTPVEVPADISAPAVNKAVLTLADGRKIVLETAGEGALATEGNMQVRKASGGELVYEGASTEIRYNTLTVPRGSQPVRVMLADGSRVVINVASTLTYPTAFAGTARRVSLTGEAYFEVTHAASPGKMPFIVETGGMEVEVKGTRFNVNAYSDEANVKTTLLEGAVAIRAGMTEKILSPGGQAIVANGSGAERSIRINDRADLEEAMAWVNGKFRFNNADAETVMRQVARWYDVEVKFAAKPRLRFGGQIDRNSTLRQMFTILETSGLRFTLQGKVVTVLL